MPSNSEDMPLLHFSTMISTSNAAKNAKTVSSLGPPLPASAFEMVSRQTPLRVAS